MGRLAVGCLALVLAVTGAEAAQALRHDTPMCVSASAVEELIGALRRQDTRHQQALLANDACLVVALQTEYSLIERYGRGVSAYARVRVYGPRGSAVLWVPLIALD